MKLKSYTNKDRYGNMTSFEFYEDSNVPMMEGIPDHPGNPKGTDTVPAWLTPGEFVMNAEATRMFEPQIEQMNNAGRAMQAQQGGTIPEYAAHGGQMPAANIDGNEFAKAAIAVGLPTDNATLNKLVNLVNQGMSVQEAAKRIANVPQYEANGGPVYMNQGGSWLDSLLGMFANKVLPEMPDATQGAIPPSDTSRDERVAALIEAAKTDGPTRPDPTMSNKMYMDFLKDKEGFRNEAYLDSAGVPTIGYGFTEGVKMGDTISEKEANKRLLKEMARTDQDYNRLVTADLNPNQQAAVKSLLYNIGGPQFANSKARAALNAGDFESFKKEAAEFRMANGKVIPGLENRRRDELELFDTPSRTAKEIFDERIPDLQGKANERTSAEEFSGTGTAPRTAKEVFDERIPALRDKVDEKNLTIPDELTGSEMGRRRTAQEVFDSRIPALQSRVNDRTAAEEFSGTGTAPRTAQEIFNERIPALQSKVAEKNLSIPDELSGPEMGRGRTRKEIFDSRIPALQNMANPEANEMLQASEFEGLGGVPPMDGVPPIDFSQYSDGPFGPRVPDAIGPRSEDQQIRDEVLLEGTTETARDNQPMPVDPGLLAAVEAQKPDSKAEVLGMEDEYDTPPHMQTPKMYGKRDYGADIIYDSLGNPQAVNPNRIDPAIMERLNKRLAGVESPKISQQQYDNLKTEFDAAVAQDAAHKQSLIDRKSDKKFSEEVAENARVATLQNRREELKDNPAAQAAIDKELGVVPPGSRGSGEFLDDGSGRRTPPPIDAPPKTDSSVTGMENEYDEELDSTTQTIIDRIIADENFKDDGTTSGQTEDSAIKTGENADPKDVSKAESFLSDIFGDLFDKDELKRMAIMYVGSRMMGGSHNGSMNFAAKQYVSRVDKKVATKKAEEKALAEEKRLDKKALAKERRQLVDDLIKSDKRTPESIAAFEKSGDPRDLVTKPVLTKPPIRTGTVKTFYDKGGRGKVTAVEMKDDNGNIFYVNSQGKQLNPFAFHQDESLVPNTQKYIDRELKIGKQMGEALEDLIKRDTVVVNGKEVKPVGFAPGSQGIEVARWMNRNNIPVNYMGSILESAYAAAAAEQKATGDKVTNITSYLDKAFIDRIPGNEGIFTREDGERVDSGKVMNLIGQGVSILRSKPGQESKSDEQLQNDMLAEMRKEWFALDDKVRGEYNTKGTNEGETGFMVFMQQQIAKDVKQS